MKDLLVIIVYFGEEWPQWFSLFLKSCGTNPWIDWKIFTDIPPILAPENVSFTPFSAKSFKILAEEKLGISPTFIDPYKICDFRIAFGKIFEEHLVNYKYWGHGDIDVVYGNLGKFIAPLLPYRYDVISLASNRLTGHLGLLRNYPETVNKYKTLRNWEHILKSPDIMWKSEYEFAKLFSSRDCYFQDLDPFDRFIYKRRSDFIFSEGLWKDGSLYVRDKNKESVEVPIYHFYVYLGRYLKERPWKRFRKLVHVSTEVKSFKITSIGIFPEE